MESIPPGKLSGFKEEDMNIFIKWKQTTMDWILKSGVDEEAFYGEDDVMNEEIDYGKEVCKGDVTEKLWLPYKKYYLRCCNNEHDCKVQIKCLLKIYPEP